MHTFFCFPMWKQMRPVAKWVKPSWRGKILLVSPYATDLKRDIIPFSFICNKGDILITICHNWVAFLNRFWTQEEKTQVIHIVPYLPFLSFLHPMFHVSFEHWENRNHEREFPHSSTTGSTESVVLDLSSCLSFSGERSVLTTPSSAASARCHSVPLSSVCFLTFSLLLHCQSLPVCWISWHTDLLYC